MAWSEPRRWYDERNALQAEQWPELKLATPDQVSEVDAYSIQRGELPSSMTVDTTDLAAQIARARSGDRSQGGWLATMADRWNPPGDQQSSGLEFDDPAALGEGQSGYGPIGPQGPSFLPTGTGNNDLDQRLAGMAAGFGDRNVPDYSAGESIGYAGQVAGVGAELATSSYADALGLGTNPILEEVTRPINYLPIGKGVTAARAVTQAVGGRLAVEAAQPLVEKLPEGVRPAADLALNIAGQEATGHLYGRSGGALGMGVKNVGDDGARRAFTEADDIAEGAIETAPKNVSALDRLTAAIAETKPLQQQNKELLSQFRSRQAGSFHGAAGAGEGGFARGLSAMRGSADRVSFEPLRDALDQLAIDSLYDKVMSSGLRPFEQANAGAALRSILDGQVPTPSELAKLEEVMPGLTKSLRDAKIVSGPSLWEQAKAFAAVPQSLMSSLDLSGFRQTATAAYGHPVMAAQAFKKSLRAAAKEDTFKALQDDLNSRWYAPMRREAGVVLSGGEQGLTDAEGTLASKMLNNIVPGYRASQRAYATMLNEMRDGLFQRMLNDYGGDASKIPVDELHRWGKMINISTGRGVLPAGVASSNIAGSPIFWAPRLLAARVEMPFELLSSSPQVRKEVARQLVSFVGVNSAILGLGKAAGVWDVEADPRSADFGQIRVGQTRIDPWGGFRPIANLVARMAVSGKNAATGSETPNFKSTTTGDLTNRDALDIASAFIRQKFSPLTGIGANLVTGEDQIGQPYGAKDVPGDAFVPLFIQNLYEAVKNGSPKDVALSTLGGLGLGVNTYERSVAERGYKNVSADEQFEAMPAEAWRIVTERPEFKNAGSAGTFYAWRDRKVADWAKVYQEQYGLSRANADAEARAAVDRTQTAQYFHEITSWLRDRWVREHPKEAMALWESQLAKPERERDWTPTREQRAILEAGAAQR